MKAPTWHAAGVGQNLERSERQKKIIMDPITDQQAKNPNAVEPEQCDATISFNGGLNCRSRC